MISFSFSEVKGKQRANKVFVDGKLLRGATAHIYEKSEFGTTVVPEYAVASFGIASINNIGQHTVSDL